MNPMIGFFAMSTMFVGAGAPMLNDATLREVLQQRLHGDRTGACFAAAVIDKTVARAVVCADAENPRAIDAQTAFEIGSVSKTMTATLAAELIADGKLALDEPVSTYLPKGTKVPEFSGKPILLRHLATHTSGLPALPSRMKMTRPDDPYAGLTAQQLYASLADVQLAVAPGARFEYSNFAMMLFSDIVARQSGKSFDLLIEERLFEPLQMNNSFVTKAPKGTRIAVGHLQTGAVTSAWNFPANVAGVGGVRASLDDMVGYVEAQLGKRSSALDPAITMTQEKLVEVQGRQMAMNWMLMPVGDRVVLAHEGGTGGFSSIVLVDPEHDRGVVILSDTALTALGGLGPLGMHLLDGSAPLEVPRRSTPVAAELLAALVGEYQLQGGMKMKLSSKDGALVIQATGQPAFVMGHDSRGDFFPLDFDAVLRPQRGADGRYGFTWLQGGGAMTATPIADASPTKSAAYAISDSERAEYVGNYPLMPGFVLAVIVDGDKLYVQGSGQPRIAVDAVAKDLVVAAAVGAEITFERGTDGKVMALTLKQGGQILRGVRE